MSSSYTLSKMISDSNLPFTYVKDTIAHLKKCDNVYIFGAGTRASYLKYVLESQGCKIQGFLINKQYFTQGLYEKYLQKYVFCYEDTIEKTTNVVLLLGGGYHYPLWMQSNLINHR